MQTLPLAGLAVLLLVPLAGGKQTSNKPDLKLTVSLDTEAPEQQPILVIHILNQSGHVLHIPEPPLLCKSAPGALSQWRPRRGSAVAAQAGGEGAVTGDLL